jgi:hypothetical membrane protein
VRAWRIALWGPVAAPWVFTPLAAAAAALTPGYSRFSDSVSQLAGPDAPYHWMLNAGIFAYAVLVQPLGPGLHRLVGGGRWGAVLWALVVCYGLGGLGAGIWRDDFTNPVWWGLDQNGMHHVMAVATFSAIFALMFLAPVPLRGRAGWAGWVRFSWVMAALSIATALPFQLQGWPGGEGLLERAFFLTTMAWVFVTGLRVRRG